MPTEFATPFHTDSSGTVVTTSDPDTQVRQHISSLINTQQPERVMLPTYGVRTMSLIFEDMDNDDVSVQAAQMITSAFLEWEPGVELIKAVPANRQGDEFTSFVDVEYRRKDAPDVIAAAGKNMALIGANGTVKEVVRG